MLLAGASAVLLVLGAGWLAIGGAQTRPNLPPVPARDLIASSLAAASARTPVSGTVRTHVDLGIPQLPSSLSDPAGPLGILVADQTFKVWYGSDGLRVAQILPFGERDLVANGTDLWFWDSQRFAAWHYAVDRSETAATPSLADLTDMVSKALRELEPYATVSVADPEVVAGRDAYVLQLSPTTTGTLVSRIDVAIDATTRLPLRVQVFARGDASPTVEAGYTSVDFGSVSRSMFTFSPPAGATVKQASERGASAGSTDEGPPTGSVRVFGRGFDVVLAVRVPAVPADLQSVLPYRGPIGSADVVERGDHSWIVAGLVPPAALAEVEPELP